jgi:hypothetical protein
VKHIDGETAAPSLRIHLCTPKDLGMSCRRLGSLVEFLGDKELVEETLKAAGWWVSGYIMHQKPIRKVRLSFALVTNEQTNSDFLFNDVDKHIYLRS